MSEGKPRVLVVDDSADLRSLVRRMLERRYEVLEAAGTAAALRAIESDEPDGVLLDLNLGAREPDGFAFLGRVRELDPYLPVVVLSAYDDSETVVQAMRAGAVHFVSKTPHHEELSERLRAAIHERRRALRAHAARLPPLERIVGSSPPMEDLRAITRRAAECNLPVLVLGETGAGKGLVARCIHAWGPRGQGPYREVNVASLPSTVLDSELFGHERGSFTGAERRQLGLFELTSGGSILLDEIGDLPRECQIKLLQVVEDGRFHRLGSEQVHRTDTRILAATHRDLDALVDQGLFRADLYHRLHGLTVHVPPLREHPEDIPELIRAFLGLSVTLNDAALPLLRDHPWPGNVRQLQQVLRRAALFAEDDRIEVAHLHDAGVVPRVDGAGAVIDAALFKLPYHDAKERFERSFQRAYLGRLLHSTGGNVMEAARRSGVSRGHLHSLIKELSPSHDPGDA